MHGYWLSKEPRKTGLKKIFVLRKYRKISVFYLFVKTQIFLNIVRKLKGKSLHNCCFVYMRKE